MRLYIVKAGDTLSSIADKYGLELEQLLAINPQITDPDNIMPGMKIKIASGPVSIGPGQPEVGHPIHQMPQEQMPQVQTPQVETPFMQMPIPAIEAGQSGSPLYPINGQSGVGMNGHVGSPSMSGSYTTAAQGSANSVSGVGSSGTTGSVGENTPYLSTIPDHFAGNPLYSGVGTNLSSHAQGNDNAQLMSGSMHHSHTGSAGMSSQQPSNDLPSPSYQQMNQPYHQMNLPYQQQSLPNYQPNQSLNVQPSVSPVSGAYGVWPDSTYSWSTAFEQMTMPNMPMYPTSTNASLMQTASNVPFTMQSANQMPLGLQSANQMPLGLQSANQMPIGMQAANSMAGLNVPLANSMPMASQTANAMPVMKKKPCGCGGSKVGHYSLAQKRIAEGHAQSNLSGDSTLNTDDIAGQTLNEDRSIATAGAAAEQQQNTQAVQVDEKPAAEIKQSSRRKPAKNRTSKRRTQKRQRSKAKIHRRVDARSDVTRSSFNHADEFGLGDYEEAQDGFDSRQPQGPWLNV